jgi:thiosulfate dehydrogenase [quinone] large subunit
MSKLQKITLFLSRVSLGWIFFYAGLTKLIDPKWSAGGFLSAAGTFPAFFRWLAGPDILPVVNFLNEWGLILLGVSLILGIFVRFSSFFGAILMVLYYFAHLKFPHPDPNSFIVDDHIIYAFLLLYFLAVRAGKVWGLDGFFRRRLG